ncbi:tachykinin-like peptides receptor 86C isoform X2 [Neocloeon triangulifer]|uniref:tachykinin-like peptides receptor 86C isoform X2 n=1 Tax=Neocloeon triangulifer TaxID=2078957 RepID=UPI00286F9BCD|nr:tachykinin-like peptides receptor 86C isoform X2 [Neocloeon triangulifer]
MWSMPVTCIGRVHPQQKQQVLLGVLSPLLDDTDFSLHPERKGALRQFLTDCLFPAQPKPFALPWWQKTVWSVVFGAMLLVAVGGNAIVMWIVLAHRRMRSVTNYFLVNLSVSDMMMALLNCVFNFIYMIDSDWPFGATYCTVNNFVANVTVAASVFTLVAISLDRYVAIVKPLKGRMRKRWALFTVLSIWFLSSLLALPTLLYSTTSTSSHTNGETRTLCFLQWPDGTYPRSSLDYAYNLVFPALTYLVPVAAMAVCYWRMGRELWGASDAATQRQAARRRVVRMFLVVVTIFAVCWLPYHGYFIYAYHFREIAASSYVQHLYLAFYWLAMANAMVNPLVYYCMNHRFRAYFRRVVCCAPKLPVEPPRPAAATPMRWNRSTQESRLVVNGAHNL